MITNERKGKMDKNNVRDIDIDDDDVILEIKAPENTLKMGTALPDDTLIYIKQDIYSEIEKHASTNAKKEVGGALVGTSGTIGGIPAVIIDGYIKAKHTDSTKSTLTFTPDTWAYLYGEREKNYPDKQIVGWHRTHPGEGTALTNYDMYIEENFFNTPYSTVLISDPVAGQIAFYGWKNGRIVKMKGFTMYDDNGKLLNARQQTLNAKKAPAQQVVYKKASNLPVTISLIVIVLLLIANLVATIASNVKFNSLMEAMNESNVAAEKSRLEAIEGLTASIDTIGEKIVAADPLPDNNQDVSPAPEVTTPEQNVPEDSTPDVPVQPETTPEVETQPEIAPETEQNEDEEKYFAYTVQPGEYISLICDKFGIDYDTYHEDIIRESGIQNPDSIEIGQVIYLPKLD